LCHIYAIGACKDFYLGHWNQGEFEGKVGKGSVNKSNDFGERIVDWKLQSKEKFLHAFTRLNFLKESSNAVEELDFSYSLVYSSGPVIIVLQG